MIHALADTPEYLYLAMLLALHMLVLVSVRNLTSKRLHVEVAGAHFLDRAGPVLDNQLHNIGHPSEVILVLLAYIPDKLLQTLVLAP